MPPKVFLSHDSLFRNWKFKISAVNSVSASAIPIYIMRHSKESLTATFCYKYELFSHPDQHPKFCTLNYGISGFTKVFYFPDGRNSVGYWEKNPFLWNQWFQGYITLFWISQVVLVVFQVVTGEAHYAKASLLVQYRLICSKPHRVAIGQTSVKISESRILLHASENLLLFLLLEHEKEVGQSSYYRLLLTNASYCWWLGAPKSSCPTFCLAIK